MMIEVIVGFGRTKLLTYHIDYVTFMNYISIKTQDDEVPWQRFI